jgi:hypothetical protein
VSFLWQPLYLFTRKPAHASWEGALRRYGRFSGASFFVMMKKRSRVLSNAARPFRASGIRHSRCRDTRGCPRIIEITAERAILDFVGINRGSQEKG